MTVLRWVCLAGVLAGCGELPPSLPADPGPPPEPGAPDVERATLVHAVEPRLLDGREETQLCYSWTLDNDAPLYVEGMSFQNGGSFHHSNWFVVPEDVYEGEDGYWPCDARDFEDVSAALSGTVLFAQSTQAQQESVDFANGVVIKIPARSKLVAGVHLLNLGPDPRSTAAWLELDVVHPTLVEDVLSPLLLGFYDLQIPAMARSRFSSSCALADVSLQQGLELHYVMSHFHGTGVSAELSAPVPGGMVREIYRHEGFSAGALGQVLDPPQGVGPLATLRFSCGYDNPYPQALEWGIGINEMCLFLGLVTGPGIIAGGVNLGDSEIVAEDDGVLQVEGRCGLFTAPRGLAHEPPSFEERSSPLVLPPFADDPAPALPTCEDTPGRYDGESPPTLAEVQERVFGPWCSFSSCHGNAAAGGLDLRGDDLRERLVDVASAAGGLSRVVPGDAEASYLYQLLSQCDPPGARPMPVGAPTLLDPELVGLVRAWIDADAP